jgi:hypothetical protein
MIAPGERAEASVTWGSHPFIESEPALAGDRNSSEFSSIESLSRSLTLPVLFRAATQRFELIGRDDEIEPSNP